MADVVFGDLGDDGKSGDVRGRQPVAGGNYKPDTLCVNCSVANPPDLGFGFCLAIGG